MMEGGLDRTKLIAIFAVVLLATAYNQFTVPVVLEAAEEPSEWYNAAGAGFEGDVGMRFNYSRLGDGDLSYREGYFFRERFENETHLPFISITWQESDPMDVDQAVYLGYNMTDVDSSYVYGDLLNVSIFEHYMLYTDFNKTIETGDRTGFIGYWNCTNSGRIHTLLVENDFESNRTELFRIFNTTRASARDHYPGQRPPGSASIPLPFDPNTVINVALMIMLTIGFSFTFMMEGFPNFAHTSYGGMGALVTFYLTRFFNFNPYDTWPLAALFGGLMGVALYRGIVKPIRRHGGYQDITLTFTFIVIAQVLPYLYLIFNFWSRFFGDVPARGYSLGYYDFNYNGIPGIMIMSSAMCIMLILGLRYFLTHHKIGLSLRAVAENEALAATIGVNTHRAHMASWFISGALSALVGSIMTLHRGTGLAGPDGMIISVMSGAILGGVYNIYGAIIGGLFVALASDILRKLFFYVFGLGIEYWAGLLPIGFLVIALFIFPNGVAGPGGIDKQRLTDFWIDVKKILGITQEDTAS